MIIRHTRRGLTQCRNTLHPPPLQASPTFPLGHRNFHASRPHHFVGEAIQLSSSLFHLVHDTSGLSWALSIPLTAAIAQLAFMPLHYLIDTNTKKRSQSANLLIAWRNVYRSQAMEKRIGTDNSEAEARKAQQEVTKKLKAKAAQLRKDMGYKGAWLNLTGLLYVPLWLSNQNALRQMCGVTQQRTVNNTILPDGIGIPDGMIFPDGTNISLEPALLTDGLLWFTDLTIADPTFLLPLSAWALIWAGFTQSTRNRDSNAIPSTTQALIRSVMKTIVLLSGPFLIANGYPSAFVLAIIGSTSTAILRRAVLDRLVGKMTGVPEAKPRKPVPKKRPR
jgi:mitochondrial inner membrane protein COX18